MHPQVWQEWLQEGLTFRADYGRTHLDAGCPRPKPRAATAQRTAVSLFPVLGWVMSFFWF